MTYLLLAIGLFGLSEWVKPMFPGLVIRLVVNTAILLLYAGFIFALERNGLLKMLLRKK